MPPDVQVSDEAEVDYSSAARAARLAGVSYRQMDYWIRTGLFTPSVECPAGSGHRRQMTPTDVNVLYFIGRLMAVANSSEPLVRAAIATAVHTVTAYPNLLDEPLLFVGFTGRIHTEPTTGWAIDPRRFTPSV